MNEQLDVFLGAETKPFLLRLFDVIKTEEYLDASVIDTLKQQSTTVSGESISEPIASSQETVNTIGTMATATPTPTPASDSDSGSRDKVKSDKLNSSKTNTSPHLVSNEQSTTTDNDSDFINTSPLGSSISKLREVSPISPVKSGNPNENDGYRRETRRRSARSRSRSRSRSRRTSEREKYNRHLSYRNKSPPNSSVDSDNRRKSNPFRRNSGHEIRSPKYYKRSHSPMDNADDRKGTRSLSPVLKGDRCRDFDEKGYCMRGETCPWDHGVNPVVLEDINNPTLMTIQAAPLRTTEYNPDAPELWIQGGGGSFNGTNRAGIVHNNAPPNAYPRLPGANAPGFRGGPPFPFPNAGAATTPLQRELISVPVVEANAGGDISAMQKRRYEPEDTVAVAEGPSKRKIPIGSRLGMPVGRVPVQNNCSLELRKVPRGLNSIAHLNNHFCKFGKIVNIQVSYEGDPEAAIVTFSTHAEANVAYRSTEAVLNNRFIKVFWHAPGAGAMEGNHTTSSGINSLASSNGAVKDEPATNVPGRKSSQYSLNNTVPATPTPATTDIAKSSSNSSIASNSTTLQQSQMATNRLRNNRINRNAAPEAIRKKKEEQVKAAVQLAHGLHKRKHEIVQGYLKQMRTCVELVGRCENNDPQRQQLLETIKNLQRNIDALNKEIALEQAQITAQIQPNQQAAAQHPFRKSKELAIKEILDTELELMAQQQEGNDTTAIQKRIEELQKKLGTVSKPSFPVRGARVRPAPPGSTSVDRRPTTILIAGFAVEDCDIILGHFKVKIYTFFSYLVPFAFCYLIFFFF